MGTSSNESPRVPAPGTQPVRGRRRPRFGADVRHHRKRALTYALFAGALVLMVNALVGENGYLAGLRAKREYDAVQASLNKLKLENQRLFDQARRLKDDPAAIEDAARRELGLIRPGETLVIVHDSAK